MRTARLRVDEMPKPRLGVRDAGRYLTGEVRQFGTQAVAYLSNHVVNRVPSYTVRHLWYREVLDIEIGRDASLQLGLRLWFNSLSQTRGGGNRIGVGTRVNRDCLLDTRGGLSIGAQVSISPEVAILTADHDCDVPGFPMRCRPVVIEDHVWIGMRAIILPGVRIGRGAVVAVGAVVTRDVEPLTVVAGVPARVIGSRDPRGLDYAFCWSPPLFE
jgi:maltose O-acetyltransferase